MIIDRIYHNEMTAEQFAQALINEYYGGQEPFFPIDPFKMVRDFGIVYQFMEFVDLEGIYILPKDDNDIPIIGINFNRPIARQRFTVAHELCHHLKDCLNNICPIDGKKNEIEKYADAFAAELLMPTKYLRIEANKYAIHGKVNRNDILKIAEKFGVSFESAVFSIAYKLKMLDGDIDVKVIKRENRKFKPEQKKKEMGFESENLALLEQMINSYEYFWSIDEKYAWYKFKNDFIYNENRLEMLNLDDDVVAEIIADLRNNKNKSQYCNETCEEIIQVAGHSALYDYIYDTNDELDIYKLCELNKMLYQYAPYPDAGGLYRQDNNIVVGAEIETVDYHMIAHEINELDNYMKSLIEQINELSISDVIKQAAFIHHRITVIHPFWDGNGRCSRALLNWIYKLKGIPPIYIKYSEKHEYYRGLSDIDKNQNYEKLLKILMREIIQSSIQLNRVSLPEN